MAAEDGVQLPVSTMEGEKEEKELPPEAPRMSVDKLLNEEKKRAELLAEERQETMQNTFRVEKIKELTKGNSTSKDGENISRSSLLAEVAGEENGSSPQVYEAKEMLNETSKEESNKKLISEVDLGFQDVETATKEASSLGTQQNAGEESRGKNKDEESNLHSQGAASAESAVVVNHVPDLTRDINLDTRGFSVTRNEDEDKENTLNITTAYFTGDQPETICHRKEEKDSEISSILKSTKVDLEGLTSVVHGEARANKESLSSLARVVSVETECESSVSEAKEEKFQTGNLLIAPSVKDKSIWTAESADKNQEAKSTNDKAEEKILKLNMSDHDSENVSISSYSGNPQKQDEQEETEIGASAEQLKSPLVAELTEETISEDIGPDRVEELEARAGTAFEKEIQETIKLHENTEELTPNKFENQGKNNSKSSPITETQTSSCNKPASTMRIPSMASVLAMENQPALEHKTTLLEEVVVKSRDIESYKVEERSDSRFDQPIMKQDDNLQKESEELALTEVLMSEERVGEVSRGSSEDNIVAEEPIKPGIFNNEKDPEDIFPINELGKENHNESFQLEKTALDQHSERVTSEEQRSIEDLQDNLDEGNTRASKTGNIKAKDTQQEKNVSTIGSTEKAYSTVLYNTVKDTHETGRCPESAVSEELSTAGVSSLELTLTTEVEAGKLERAKQNLQVSNDRGNMEEEMQQQDEEKDDRDNIEEKMQQQDEVPLKEHSASQSSSDKETKLKESLTVRNSKPVRPKEEQDGMKSDETKGNSSEEVASELTEPDDMNNDETEGNSLEEAVTKEEPDDTGSIKTVCPKKESQEMTDDDTKGYTSEEVASEPKEPDDTNNDETTGNSSEEVVSKQPDETGSIKTVCPKEPDEMNDDETKGNSLEEVASELKDDQRNGTEMETDTIIDEIRTEEVYHNTQAEQKETQILDRQQGVTGYLVESSNEESSVEEKTKANQEVETEKIEPKAADASAGKRDLLEEKESQNKPQASVYDETIADNCEGENIVTQNMKEDCGDKNKFTAFVTGMEKEDSREEKEKRESDTEKIPQGQEREKKIARETKSSGDSYPKSLEEEIIQETFQEDEEKMHIIAGAKMSKEESLNPTIPISLVAEGSVEGNSTKEQDVMKLEKERKDRDTEGTGQNYEATDYADDGKMETLKHEGDTNVLGDTDSRTVSAESAKELPPREYEELAQHNSVPKGSERSKEETVDTEESTGILATEEKEVKLKEEMQFDSYTPTSEKMDQVATKTNETEADDINSRSKHQHVSNLEENEDMKVLAAEGNGKEGTRAIIEQEQQYDIHDKLLESEHHKAIGGTFSHDTLEQNAEDPSNLPFDKQNIVTEACKEIDESPEKYEDEEVQKPIGGEEFSRNTESDSNQCFNTDEQELQLKTEEHAHQMEESENNMSNNMVEQESEHHKAIGEAVVHDTLEQNAEDPSNLPFDRQNIVTTEACKKLDESPEKSEGFSISTGAHTALELAEDTEVQKPTGGGEEFPGDPESDSNQCFNTDEQEHHSKTEEQARQIEDSESNNTSSTVEKESEDQAIGGALSHDTLEQNAEDPFDLPFNKQNIATTEASKKIDESPEKSEGFLITTEALSEVDLAEHTEVQNLTRGGEEFSGDTESNSNQCFNSDERELHLKAEEHAHQTENSESNNTSNTVEKESEDQAIGGALSHDTLEQNAEDPFDLPFNKQNIVTTEACKNIDESPEKSEGFCITTEALSAAKIADDTEVQKHTGGEEFSGNTESDSNQCFNTDEQELQLKAEEHARQIENSESNNTSNMVEKESEDQAIGGALSHDTLEQNAEDQLDFPFNKQNIVTTEASKKIDESPEKSEGFRINTEALSEVELAEHTEVQKPTGGKEFSGDTESDSNQCFSSDERNLQLKAEERAHQTENSESNNTSNMVEKGSVFLQSPEELPSASELIAEECNNRSNPKSRMATVQEGSQSIKDQNTESIKEQNFLDCQSETNEGQELISEAKELIDEKPKTNEKAMEAFLTDEATQVLVGAERLVECENIMEKIKEEKMPEQKLQSSPEETYYGSVPNQISEGQHSNKTTQDANLTKELDQETGPTDTSAAKALGKIEIADMVTKTTELVKEDSYLQESQMPAQANATVNEANDPQLSPVKDLCTGCAATSGETTETVIMKGVEATLWEGKGLLITKESEEQRGKNEKLADVTSLASQATEDNVIKSETFIHADELCENINISRRLEKEEGRRLEEVRVYDKSLQAIETYLGDKPETIEETQSAHSEVDGDKLGDISALVSQVQTTESDIADKRIIISETSDLNENEAAGKAIADQVHKLQDQGIEQLLESKGIQTVIQNNADKVEEHISNGIESKSAAKCESPEAVVEANLAPIQSNPEPAVVDEVEETSFTVLPKEEDHKISDGIENKKGQSAKIDEYTVNETSNSSLVTIPGEEFLQKGIQASESDSKGIAIEAVEKEDRDTETPKLKPKEYVTEMGFSDPSAVKCEKNMELGLVEKSKDEENLKSENINKVDDQLTISNSAVKDDPSHKVSQKYEEAADPAAPGKFLDAVPEDGNTEEFFKAEKIDINKKLETATTGTREEEILIEESKKTKQTSWNDHSFKISNENTGAEDSCHGSPDEEISQRIYQEDELKPEVYPRVQINEISENAKNTRQSEKKQMPSEDKTVEEPCQDSPPEETVTDSPEEEEKEGKNVEDTTSLLELQEKADKLNSGKTGNEVKIANEKVEDSEITSPKIDEDSQRSNDQDNIVEKDSEVTNTNTCFAPVIDDVNSRESPENSRGYVVSEAEPVEAVNEAIEDCEKNEDDAKTVTSNLSLIDCESPHYSPNESSCNISNVTRGLNLESQEQYAEKSAIPEDDKSKEIEKTEECLLIADKESTEEVCTTAQERSSKDDEKQQEAKEQVKLSTSTRGMKPCGDDIPARTTESEDTIFHDKDENYNGQLMDQEPTTRQILAEAELQSLNASKVVPEDKKTGDECKEIMGKSTSMTLDPTSESNLVDGAKEDSLQVADDPCEDSCIKIAHKDAPINLTKANDNTDEIHKPIESPIRISDLEILTKPDPRIAMGTKLPSGQKEFPQMLHSPMDGTLQQEIENSEAAVEGERGAECLESKKLNPDCKDRIESFKPTTSAESSPSNLQQSTKRTEQKQDDGETEDQHENLLAISQINTSTLTEKTNQDPVNVSSALDAKIPLGMQKLEVDSFSVLGKHIAAQADPSGSSTSQMSTLELQQNAIGDNPEPAKVEPEEATCVEEKGISEEAISKSILMETRTSLSETLEMPKRAISQVTRDFIAESDQEVQKEELKERKKTIIEHEEPKTDEDKEEEVEGEEEKRRDSAYDIPVTVKAPRDIDVKVAHKKSHNILAGVGSKVKHSIAKVKKAITGKSSHPKPPSPK